MKKYVEYTVEDFVTDDHFRKWILNGGKVEDFWKQFLPNSPEKQSELSEAAQIVKILNFRSSHSNSDNMEQALLQTLAQIDAKKSLGSFGWVKYAAAAIALFLFASILFLYTSNFGYNSHTTAFGEKQEIVLPDGSEVTLNSNSSITYDKNWDGMETKKVKLQGEAFFEVVPQKNNAKFVVETDVFDVEVVGTSFNLISRPDKHQVMLKEGKVEVHLSNDNDSGEFISFLDANELKKVRESKTLNLSPNQLFEANTHKKQLLHKEVNPNTYTAWLQNKFICDQTSVLDLALFIENQYGWQVKVRKAELLEKEVSGTIPTDNLEVLLEALSLILEAEISVEKEKKEIILSDNPS